ncbi:MAG TPA: transcription elongation factor subunit Spt4 [Thermoplasmata archaeon]|nr:transcription elongation factor subunit Spt4 [Thermoplasmata archaeon]
MPRATSDPEKETKDPMACTRCTFISHKLKCPLCGNDTSKDWQGYVVVIDHTKSEIAKKMGINVNGKFALRVR